jgi:hypothetical protein
MAECNAFSNPMSLVSGLRPSPGFRSVTELAFGALRYDGLESFLALEPGELERMCFGDGPTRRVLGHELRADLVSLATRKICPQCLQDHAYQRAWWDLTVFTVCPIHAVRLLDRCECGRALNWNRAPLTRCPNLDCETDLRDLTTTPVPESEMGGIRALDQLLRESALPEFPPEIRDLGVGQQVFLMFNLGLLVRGHQRVTRPAHLARDNPEEVHLALDAGWPACRDWPSSFKAVLAGRREQAESRGGRYGIRHAFGRLHGWIEWNGDEPFARLLRQTLREYMVGCPEMATRAPDIRKARSEASLQHRHMTLQEAARLLGVANERVRSLAFEHDLYIVSPTGKGAPALLRADLVYRLHAERSRLLTKADVRRRLGTGKRAVERLRASGFIPVEPGPETPDIVRYPVEAVDALLEKFAAKIPPGAIRSAGMVNVAGVARLVSRQGYTFKDVLMAVDEGRLTPAALDRRKKGFQGILFRAFEARSFARAERNKFVSTLSITQAARALRVHPEAAYRWTQLGLLETTQPTFAGEAGRRVTEAALRRFRETYVTGPEVAVRFKLERRWTSVHLEARNIEPVSGPKVDGARQYLFRRIDIAKIKRADLISGGARRPEAAEKRLHRNTSEGLRGRLAAAACRELGTVFQRKYGRYSDPTTDTLLVSKVGGNYGLLGCYGFLFRKDQVDALWNAATAWVAFAFADREDFLLVPWREVEPLLEAAHTDTKGRHFWRLKIRASRDGSLSPFGAHVRALLPRPGRALPIGRRRREPCSGDQVDAASTSL